MKVFTFWEGKMPAYVELCMKTWKIPYVLLNYENVNQYTDIPISKLKRFTLPQIADYVRVHVLRDNGGFWLDTDTIMLKNKLPVTNMLGYPNERAAHIGYLNATRDVGLMFKKWAEYQDEVLNVVNDIDLDMLLVLPDWDIMGNRFSDDYIKKNKNVSIGFVQTRTPEVTFIRDDSISRKTKYETFYFNTCQHLSNFVTTDILMLHNSWTPSWYKELTKEEVLANDCTLSNILREVLS